MAKKKKKTSKVNKKTNKSVVSKRKQKVPEKNLDRIVIDEKENLIFTSEEDLYNHFSETVESLEEIFFAKRADDDLDAKDFKNFEECLPLLLEDPLEVWDASTADQKYKIFNYIGEFEDEEAPKEEAIYYIAQVYMAAGVPTFVYLHFPSVDENLVEKYRVGQLIFDQVRGVLVPGAMDGDALSEGDKLAEGLYQSMLKVRGEGDILENDFHKYIDLRGPSIEEADEIWQNTDMQGNVLVNFIREFPDFEVEGEKPSNKSNELYYVVTTVEEGSSGTHALLFSFPTTDRNLVDRYRHGENLQADEVVPHSNH